MKFRLTAALSAALGAWIWALAWLYDGMPPWDAWRLFGLPVIAFCLCAGLRALGPPRPAAAKDWLLLATGAFLLASAWCADLGLFPVWAPLAAAPGREGLRFWLFQLVLGTWAGLLTGRTLAQDLRMAEAVGLALAVAALSWGGAYSLREGQRVEEKALANLFLDRSADPSGERPRSNMMMQKHGAARVLQLQAVMTNDNPFPVWGVEVDLILEGTDPIPLLIRDGIPAHDSAPLLWARRYKVEDLPKFPGWKVVVRRARRHWGGAPRLTVSGGGIQSPPS